LRKAGVIKALGIAARHAARRVQATFADTEYQRFRV
jgi:hypothetical protein